MGSLIGSTFRDTLAAQFNGVDEYMYVDNPTFKANNTGAFAFWYRPDYVLGVNGNELCIGYGVKDAGNNSLWWNGIRRSTSATLAAPYRNVTIPEAVGRATNGGAVERAYGQHVFVATTWVHWVVQSDGSAITHYINGSSVGGFGWNGDPNNGIWLGDVSGADHRLAFGTGFASNAPAGYNGGRQNECIYVSRPLTTTEITALYNAGTPRNPHRVTSLGSDLKSWWRFGDSRDDATTVYDEIGSNDLTLVNMDAANYVTP